MNRTEDARIRFTALLASNSQFKTFAEHQGLSGENGLDLTALNLFVQSSIGDSRFMNEDDLSILPDFVELLFFVSSRHGKIEELEISRLYTETGITNANSLLRSKTSGVTK
jgi:hypothetical protein